jgi:hypothetical protein
VTHGALPPDAESVRAVEELRRMATVYAFALALCGLTVGHAGLAC